MSSELPTLSLRELEGRALQQALANVAWIGYRQAATVAALTPEIISLLAHNDAEVRARSCWALGQIGFRQPAAVEGAISALVARLVDVAPEVRARALWALGRIGRADPGLVEVHLPAMLACANDPVPQVRMNVIWASENIATVCPEWFSTTLPVFLRLLDDPNTRYVRPEAPEIFRVIGKRRPDPVAAALPALTAKLDDACRVTRIHAQGALNAIQKAQRKE